MGTAKRLRIAALEEARIQRLQDGIEEPSKKEAKQYSMWLRCGKCKHLVPERLATVHLETCQPAGAVCSKCDERIPVKDFIDHIKACPGKTKLGTAEIDMKPHSPQRWSEKPEPCQFNTKVVCRILSDDRPCETCWARPKAVVLSKQR